MHPTTCIDPSGHVNCRRMNCAIQPAGWPGQASIIKIHDWCDSEMPYFRLKMVHLTLVDVLSWTPIDRYCVQVHELLRTPVDA